MDIRTKLVFALVAVALGSMLSLGTVMYFSARDALIRGRLDQLEGIAESMKDGLEEVSSGWRDRVSLIASRTQLRQSLRDYNQTENPEDRARIRRILADALSSVDIVQSLVVYDAQGVAIASAGWGLETDLRERLPLPLPETSGATYQGAMLGEADSLRVGYAAPLFLDGNLQGMLHVRFGTAALMDLTENRAKLGNTWEVMIVVRDIQGTILVLRRQRPGTTRSWEAVRPGGPDDPVTLALEGEELVRSEGISDYRNTPVWAAIRVLPETGWGLIVELEAQEATAPIGAFRNRFIRLSLSLGAFAILLGTILGLRFAAPIHDLAEVAGRIREGALSARARVSSEDEVGVLAKTFNQMAEELEQQVSLLREFQRYFDLSLDMLCIAATDGYFKRVNPAFERTLGWSTETLLRKSFLDFVHPGDIDATEEEIGKLAKGIPTISFENRYRCSDGSYKTLVWTAHPEPETGLIYAIARDVTAQKERQERSQDEIRSLRHRLEEAVKKSRGAP